MSEPTKTTPSSVDALSGEYERALDALRDVVARGARSASATRRARLDAEVVALTDALARVARRPDEPRGHAPVVKFTKRFAARGPFYDYAAVKSGDGYWYVTTRDSDAKAYTWDELLNFVYDRFNSEKTLVACASWTRLVEEDARRR